MPDFRGASHIESTLRNILRGDRLFLTLVPPSRRHGRPKKATGVNPPPEGAAVLRSFAIAGRRRRLGVALGDERVRLIGELGEGEQVVEAELCVVFHWPSSR